VQRDPSTLSISFSSYINESKQQYYKAYFNHVYNQICLDETTLDTTRFFQQLLDAGKITAKETDLWNVVLSDYGTD
jgi:Fic family protein